MVRPGGLTTNKRTNDYAVFEGEKCDDIASERSDKSHKVKVHKAPTYLQMWFLFFKFVKTHLAKKFTRTSRR